MQACTGTAIEAISRITARMQQIGEYTSAAAKSAQEQHAATEEISNNVSRAAEGTKGIVALLGELSGAADETQGSAETVLAASEAVAAIAEDVRKEVEEFLRRVAA